MKIQTYLPLFPGFYNTVFDPSETVHEINPNADFDNTAYELDVAKKTIGAKKYRGKDFGGGIVFTSYNVEEYIEKLIQ